ncbi:serine hydrolase domain-containing protein [Hoeflea sp. TYP-13]|uniref:serine hydrolase domain-containing protein n=1 Tax=Hoeflea sp. TYP-13 TaxID=3230023 RepID=UPI0034C66CD1
MRILISLLLLAGVLLSEGVKAEDNPIEQQIRKAFEAGRLDGLHSVLFTRKGETLAEVYFAGEDERWGTPMGERAHGPKTLHDLRSVSKSIVSLLYGIALADGLVPGPDEPLMAQFPEYADLANDPERQAITIRDVLTMQMGTAWNEDLPYTDPRNSEIAMERADDRYRFVLEQPMVTKPGTEWRYSGGSTALLARIIAKGAGKPVDEFARERLFGPLGIEHFEWVAGADGEPAAASGLRLTIRDLVKIGQMINDGGAYDGKQIIPPDWLKASFTPQAKLETGLRYGFQWYLAAEGDPPRWISGFGNGGQRLTIQPQYDFALATFAGNYNQPDAWKVPVRIIEEILVPALQKEGRAE